YKPVRTPQEGQIRQSKDLCRRLSLPFSNPPRLLARQVLQPQFTRGEEDGSNPVAESRVTAQRPAAADRFIVGGGCDHQNVPPSRLWAARLKLFCLGQ